MTQRGRCRRGQRGRQGPAIRHFCALQRSLGLVQVFAGFSEACSARRQHHSMTRDERNTQKNLVVSQAGKPCPGRIPADGVPRQRRPRAPRISAAKQPAGRAPRCVCHACYVTYSQPTILLRATGRGYAARGLGAWCESQEDGPGSQEGRMVEGSVAEDYGSHYKAVTRFRNSRNRMHRRRLGPAAEVRGRPAGTC